MKIRIADRILVAVAGLLLIALAAGVVAQTVFDVELLAFIGDKLAHFMKTERVLTTAVMVAGAALLLLLGLYCLGVMVRHEKKGKRGFVMQKTEVGELSISIKAISGLVQKCVDRHEEIQVLSTSLETLRDGLVIKLRISLTGGVNIPLAVSALQKQIKQYVTSCSGVDVKEVKVQVETADADGPTSRYAVPLLPEKAEPLPVVEEEADENPAAAAAEESAGEKRPLHQRLFGLSEEPVTVPEPPVAEPVEEESAETDPVEAEMDEEVPAAETENEEDAPIPELAEEPAEAEPADAEESAGEEPAPEAVEEAEQEEVTYEDAE